jgi:hypothetical protein
MDKIEFRKNKDNIVDIIYEGKVYGKWDVDANIRYPEDLTLDGDLMNLINIGVEIGKQMIIDEQKSFK